MVSLMGHQCCNQEETKLPDLLYLVADCHQSVFDHICRLLWNTPTSEALHLSIETFTGTHSCNRLEMSTLHWAMKKWAMVPPGKRSDCFIYQCYGDRHECQSVKHSSEWVSECGPLTATVYQASSHVRLSETAVHECIVYSGGFHGKTHCCSLYDLILALHTQQASMLPLDHSDILRIYIAWTLCSGTYEWQLFNSIRMSFNLCCMLLMCVCVWW